MREQSVDSQSRAREGQQWRPAHQNRSPINTISHGATEQGAGDKNGQTEGTDEADDHVVVMTKDVRLVGKCHYRQRCSEHGHQLTAEEETKVPTYFQGREVYHESRHEGDTRGVALRVSATTSKER